MTTPTRKPRKKMDTPKKQINIRASELTLGQLAELMHWLDANQTEVFTLAIDRMYQQERLYRQSNIQEDVSKL